MSGDDTGDEDDWFERALREASDESAGGDEPDESSDPKSEQGSDPDDTTDAGAGAQPDSGADGSESGDEGPPLFGDADGGDDSPFGSTGIEEGDPFGGGESGAFDAGEGGGDSLFDEDFEEAMGAVGGADEESFEDEELDSDIPRLDVGIEGLDNMIQGGVPERHLVVVIGGAGTGKTTFGLQFLRHGLAKDDTDRGVFITLEQSYEDIMATADEHGWEFDRHEREDDLAVVDLDPVEMANSLDNIRGELPSLIREFDADRFVLDSVSLLEMMYDEQARRRTEIYDFTRSLKDAGVTTVFTSEAAENNPYASRHGIIEYLTDAVFLLRYVRSDTQARLAVEIQKIRNANHSRETKPYELTDSGISVYEQANIF